MTQAIAESEILTDYWKFWLWQYTCRNPKYRFGFQKYSKVSMPRWVISKAMEILPMQLTPPEIEELLLAKRHRTLATSKS